MARWAPWNETVFERYLFMNETEKPIGTIFICFLAVAREGGPVAGGAGGDRAKCCDGWGRGACWRWNGPWGVNVFVSA